MKKDYDIILITLKEEFALAACLGLEDEQLTPLNNVIKKHGAEVSDMRKDAQRLVDEAEKIKVQGNFLAKIWATVALPVYKIMQKVAEGQSNIENARDFRVTLCRDETDTFIQDLKQPEVKRLIEHVRNGFTKIDL